MGLLLITREEEYFIGNFNTFTFQIVYDKEPNYDVSNLLYKLYMLRLYIYIFFSLPLHSIKHVYDHNY